MRPVMSSTSRLLTASPAHRWWVTIHFCIITKPQRKQATPHVSGLTAYLIGRDGNSSPAEMSSTLKSLSVKGVISDIRTYYFFCGLYLTDNTLYTSRRYFKRLGIQCLRAIIDLSVFSYSRSFLFIRSCSLLGRFACCGTWLVLVSLLLLGVDDMVDINNSLFNMSIIETRKFLQVAPVNLPKFTGLPKSRHSSNSTTFARSRRYGPPHVPRRGSRSKNASPRLNVFKRDPLCTLFPLYYQIHQTFPVFPSTFPKAPPPFRHGSLPRLHVSSSTGSCCVELLESRLFREERGPGQTRRAIVMDGCEDSETR